MSGRPHRRALGRHLAAHRGETAAAAGCAVLVLAGMVVLPRWAAVLVRDVLPAGGLALLARHLALGIGIVLVLTAATFGRDTLLLRLSVAFASALRETMVARILRQPLRALAAATSGELLSRISNDIAAVHHALVRGFAVFAPNAITLACLLVAMLATSWRLFVGTIVLVAPMLVALRFFGRRLHGVVLGTQARRAELVALVADCLDGAKDAKSFGREAFLEARFRAVSARELAIARHEERLAALHPATITLVGMTGLAGMVLLSAWLHGAGVVTTDQLVRYLVLLGLVVGPLQETARAGSAVSRFQAVMDRCAEVVETPIESDAPNAPSLPRLRGALALDRVTLAMPSTGFALRDLELAIEPGEMVAIVGPSGAGKSSLLDLLLRFVEPDTGRVLADGLEVRAHRRDSLRTQIALVTQEPFLFPGTLYENLTFGNPNAGRDAVQAAARAAHVDEFASRLPQAYETWIERRGANLSVGQRQRIAVARAMLKDPVVMLLDEPTSALDEESERLVCDALGTFCAGRTTVLVTHRPAMLALAHRVVEMRSGRIVSVRPGPARPAVESPARGPVPAGSVA